MDLTPEQRLRFCNLAWFEPEPPQLEGFEKLRPLSLGSKAAMEIMGLSLLDENHGLTAAQEMQQILLYLWIHTGEIAQITAALWDDSWLGFGVRQVPVMPEVLDEMRLHLSRVRRAMQASIVQIMNPPRSKWDDTPKQVIGLRDLGFKISHVVRATGWDEEKILWNLWLPKALQIYHGELRVRGFWTVAPGRAADPQEMTAESLTPDWMRQEPFVVPLIDTAVPVSPTE